MWKQRLQRYASYRRPWVWILGFVVLYGLLLGVLAPWLIERQAKNLAQQRLNLSLEVEDISINPYFFSLRIDNLRLVDEQDQLVLGFERFLVNFETTSLFRWAWSFKQLHLLGLESRFERFSASENNVTRLAQTWQATAPPEAREPEPAAEGDGGLPRFFVEDIRLQVGRIDVIDRVPRSTFRTHLGPAELDVARLTSLPDKVGEQKLRLVFANDAQVTWQGSLALAPLRSDGRVRIQGAYLQFLSDYLRDQLRVEVADNHLDVGFDYRIDEAQSGQMAAELSNLQFELSELALVHRRSGEPLFDLEAFTIADGSVHWPEQRVHIGDTELAGGRLWVTRDTEGELNLSQLLAGERSARSQPQAEPDAPTDDASGEALPWRIDNSQVALTGWSVRIEDRALPEPAELEIEAIDIRARGLGSEPRQPVAFDSQLRVAGGRISTEGRVVLQPLGELDAQVQVSELGLPALQPYVAQFAKVDLQSGRVNIEAQLSGADLTQLTITSGLAVDELRLIEQATDEDLLHWQKLALADIEVALADETVSLGQVVFDQPFAYFEIAEDGSTTIDRVLVDRGGSSPGGAPPGGTPPGGAPPGEQTEKGGGQAGDTEAESVAGDDPAMPWRVKVAQVQFNRGSAYFGDQSLPLPFSTRIAQLEGGISAIDSASEVAAELKLEGQVDEYGLLRVDGELLPFDPLRRADVNMAFSNVKMPSFNPYTVKFAGRKIAQGNLNLDLNYRLEEGQLQASNDIVLEQLKLGEKVDQPGAADLPLDLAVALLKNGQGNINVDIPISGDVNDPNFAYGEVVGKAFTRVITNIVSAPFKLLGGLVGGGSERFDKVVFFPGEATLTPPEREKLLNLAKAMKERPQLKLLVAGVYAEQADTHALREQQFRREAADALGVAVKDLSLSSTTYVEWMEKRYRDAELQPPLKAVREDNAVTGNDGERGELDQLAYAKQLRERLLQQQTLAEGAVAQLARERATQVGEFVRQQQLGDPAIEMREPAAVEPNDAGKLVLQLDLSSRED